MSIAWVLIAVGLVSGAWSLRPRAVGEGIDGVALSLLHDADEKDVSVARVARSERDVTPERIKAWICGASLIAIVWFVGKGSLSLLDLPMVGLGAALGELFVRGRRDKRAKNEVRRLEFFLPLAMERVVMAVGSGLDIIPALSEAARGGSDPISDLFRRIVSLSDNGLPVEQALRSVSQSCPSLGVKHALVHLGLAYKQGGELVRPLKELSDATQTQYQETVEEEIAKLPVKAVLPLVITFSGLLISFITVPLFQVQSMTSKVGYVQE